MTDLNMWPESWLASPIVKKEKKEHGWTLLTLENNEIWLDIGYDLIKFNNERELDDYLRARRT